MGRTSRPAGPRPWRSVAVSVVLAMTASAAADEPARVPLPCGGMIEGVVERLVPPVPGAIRVAHPLFAEPLDLAAETTLPGLPGRVGMLTSDGIRMFGCLAACGDGRLGWQPLGGSRPVAFAGRDVSASIDYRGLDAAGGPGIMLARRGDAWEVIDVLAHGPGALDGRLRVGDRVTAVAEGAFGRPIDLRTAKADDVKLLLVGPTGSIVRLTVARELGSEEIAITRDTAGLDDLAGAAAKDVLDRGVAVQQSLAGESTRGPATVHLRGGEALACAVLAADGASMTIRLDELGKKVIPIDTVKAVELSTAGVRPILKQKLARLLTVPRSQRATPPTHVVRMTGGDYLRGRLVGLDSDAVLLDIAGDVKSLPRRDVARIIRLSMPEERLASLHALLHDLDGLPIVVVGGDGRRQAVAAHGMTDGRLVGTSPALGSTTVSLGSAARVLVGAAIDELPAADAPYGQWVLTPAADPRPGETSP